MVPTGEEHERAFIRAFIVAAKRERLTELLAKPKRRRDILATLYHFADLEPRYRISIPPAEQTAARIEAALRARGAPELCYAISTHQGIDGRILPLQEAIHAVTGLGHGTLLSCRPGQLGYFEGEEPGARYYLVRTGGPTMA